MSTLPPRSLPRGVGLSGSFSLNRLLGSPCEGSGLMVNFIWGRGLLITLVILNHIVQKEAEVVRVPFLELALFMCMRISNRAAV